MNVRRGRYTGDGDTIEKPSKARKGRSKGNTNVSAVDEEEKVNDLERYQKGK